MATAVLLQWALVMYTIEALGSEEQKRRYIPRLKDFSIVGGWALTEEKIGSDAANLGTTATRQPDGSYKINGDKRWIGNGNRDVLIVWAKNTETKKVEGIETMLTKVLLLIHPIQVSQPPSSNTKWPCVPSRTATSTSKTPSSLKATSSPRPKTSPKAPTSSSNTAASSSVGWPPASPCAPTTTP